MTGSFRLGMPEAEYHAHPALSSTGARSLLRCPERFEHDRRHGRPNKDEFDFGSLVHGLILGAGWPLDVWPLDEWRGSVDGVTAADFKARAYEAKRIPVKAKQVEEAWAIRRRVMHDTVAGPYFERPRIAEISLFWRDSQFGVPCRARLDILTETDDGRPLYIELKSTANASRHEIRNRVARYGYHMQAEWGLEGLVYSALDPYADAVCKFVFVETTPPYPVVVANLDDDAALVGRMRNHAALRLYAECTRTGAWPSYVNEEITLGLPRWANFQEDE